MSTNDNSDEHLLADTAEEEGRIESFVVNRPLTAVAIAMVIGALAARLLF